MPTFICRFNVKNSAHYTNFNAFYLKASLSLVKKRYMGRVASSTSWISISSSTRASCTNFKLAYEPEMAFDWMNSFIQLQNGQPFNRIQRLWHHRVRKHRALFEDERRTSLSYPSLQPSRNETEGLQWNLKTCNYEATRLFCSDHSNSYIPYYCLESHQE